MALTLHEQFLQTLERAKRPIIVLPQTATPDDFTAAYGVISLLHKLQKPIELSCAGGRIPKSIEFLNVATPVRGDFPNIRKMTLAINAQDAKIDELTYEMVGDELRIHLLPKTGAWQAEDVKISTTEYRFDLIIVIGAADLEAIGELYKNYSDFFLSTPIINLDHNPKNEYFGAINVIDVSAVACSEVCHELFCQLDPGLVDSEVATFFLTGMIHKTKSFRSGNVTPKTLKVASDLMARGARRDEIVQKLYKTRSMATLRLWGRALSRLKANEAKGLVWTLLTRGDFASTGCDQSALENIIDELLLSSPGAKVAAVFFEVSPTEVHVALRADRPYDALALGAPFKASGTREEARLVISCEDLVAAERQAITHFEKMID
jgi:phosphoesterase RecJ-like protein